MRDGQAKEARLCLRGLQHTTRTTSVVSALHHGLGMNVCSERGRHSYMMRMYAKIIVLVAGNDVE